MFQKTRELLDPESEKSTSFGIENVVEVSHNVKAISFEDALKLTKVGKFNYSVILLTGLTLSAFVMESFKIGFVLPVAQCDMKLTTQDKGVLSAIGFAGIITSSHFYGFLADTQGRKKILQPTLLIAFVCTLLSTLTNNFWAFAVLRYLTGFFISGSPATVFTYLSEFHNSCHRSRAILGASFIFGIFAILMPGIAWLVINQSWSFYLPIFDITFKPWKLFIIVCGLPSLICGIAFFFLPESPKFVLGQGNQEKTIRILQKINRWNNGGMQAEPLQIHEIYEEMESIENRRKMLENSKSSFSLLKSMWSQTAPLFKAPHWKTTFLASTIQFGILFTSNGMYLWFPDILNRMGAYDNENPGEKISLCNIVYLTRPNISAITSEVKDISEMHCISKLEMSTYEHTIVLEIMYTIGFAFIGSIINAVGKFAILFGILVVSGLAGIMIVLVDIPLLATYFYIILLCCGLAVTVVNSSIVELYPTNLRAMGVCMTMMIGRVGSVVGANLVGFLLDYHCEAAFYFSGISLMACGFLTFLIPNIRKHEPKALERRLSISSH